MKKNFKDLTQEEIINIEKIEKRFGTDYVLTSKHDLMYNCPFCLEKRFKEDTDHKFGVNAKTTLYYCFKCHTTGILIKNKVSFSERAVPFLIDYFKNQEPSSESQNNGLIEFVDVVNIETNTLAYDYLMSRNITSEQIKYYNIKNGINSNFGRIIIPNIVIGNWVDYYQGRTYLDIQPKYNNPSQIDKSNIVFNLHNQSKKQKQVYIVEGVFSAIRGGKDVICTYGSSASKNQIEMINKYNFQEIICCYDGDEAGVIGNNKLAKELLKNNENVFIVKLPKDVDPADMGEEEFKKYVEKNKRPYVNERFNLLMSYFESN